MSICVVPFVVCLVLRVVCSRLHIYSYYVTIDISAKERR